MDEKAYMMGTLVTSVFLGMLVGDVSSLEAPIIYGGIVILSVAWPYTWAGGVVLGSAWLGGQARKLL